MSKIHITALARYAQKILETAKKLSHIFKYFHSSMKQTLHLENIKKMIHSKMETSIKSKQTIMKLINNFLIDKFMLLTKLGESGLVG